MNILELAILKKMVGGGGGSGTDNYNDLSNLPQINGETLAGNKTAENLGLQDALTFDSAPTKDSTNPVESNGVYNALAGKQDNLTFDGVYSASTNKVATESTVSNAIDELDVSETSFDANETIDVISETDGKITITKKDIAIASNQVTSMTGYTKPSSAPATPAIQTSDTANQAFGKLEFKADTNQTNILSVKQKVGVNLLNTNEFSGGTSDTGIDFTTENGIISAKGTKMVADSYRNIPRDDFKASSQYYVVATTTGSPRISLRVFGFKNGNYTQLIDTAGTAIFNTGDYESFLTRVVVGGSINDAVNASISAMIISKEDYEAGLTAFQPYAASNSDLTYLEAEDRAALAEEIDAGAKNKVNIVSPTATIGNITFTHNSDGSITVNGTANNTDTFYYLTSTTGNSGQSAVMNVGSNPCILTGCPSGGAGNTYELQLSTNSGDYRDRGTGIDIPANSSGSVVIAIRAGYAPSNLKFYPMICTKAAFGVSNKFVPFGTDPLVPINHNMIYRGRNLGATLTDAQHTALSSGNFTDLYLGDYWTKTVTIPAGTYTGGDSKEVTVPAQTNITLKAVIADFDTFYAGYASNYAGINTHHAVVIVTGFSNVVWNGTNRTAGGYVNSIIHKWLVGSALPQIETWFGSAKVLSHQKLLTNAITGDAASEWACSSQKISLLSENQIYGSKVWGGSKATNGGYEPGEAFKHLNVFNHIDANLLLGNRNIWLRDIASAEWAALLNDGGYAGYRGASMAGVAPAALILLS